MASRHPRVVRALGAQEARNEALEFIARKLRMATSMGRVEGAWARRTIRIISARNATKRERGQYFEQGMP